MKILQKGFNFSQDGPGNRLVYHMQGCNFRCKWCSNPESISLNYEKSKNYSVDDIIKEAENCRMMFFDGGGVTFTGGEPTVQFDELKQTLIRLREAGINTAIETNGSHPRLTELSEYIDFFIMDIKHPHNDIHKKYTDHSNEITLENLRLLSTMRKQLLVRIPLINNVNTDADAFINLFSKIDMSDIKVEILPYHEYGKCKWVEEYEIIDGFVPEDKLLEFTDRLKSNGINLIKT